MSCVDVAERPRAWSVASTSALDASRSDDQSRSGEQLRLSADSGIGAEPVESLTAMDSRAEEATEERQGLLTGPATTISAPASPHVWHPAVKLKATELTGSKTSLLTTTTASGDRRFCRICHLATESARNPMISPCRCAGTVQNVHTACLVHWLEISTRKMCPAPRCELCGYNYKRHACFEFQLSRVHLPHVDYRDKILNAVFLFVVAVMVLCGVVCIHYLRKSQQVQFTPYRLVKGTYRVSSTSLSNNDVTVIISSVLFFAAFFIAIFTQYRAEASIFRLFTRIWLINRNWRIRNYSLDDDTERLWEREHRVLVARSTQTPNGDCRA
uniref:RING-CH-type domain-containing protein n=1 Tax=Steinernema glaseri TaxID=37863 RepID=A0A1I8A628_9BILA